jgi:PPOX class probable F420-dependent enzyme
MTSPLTMSRAEREAFLAGQHVGVLAVADDAGGPPVTAPVWYLYEPGGDVVLSTGRGSVKARLLATAGRASFCVQREELPYAFVTVEGPVEVGDHDAELRARLAERYLGELAATYLQATEGEDSVRVRLTPERWRTQDYGHVSFG